MAPPMRENNAANRDLVRVLTDKLVIIVCVVAALVATVRWIQENNVMTIRIGREIPGVRRMKYVDRIALVGCLFVGMGSWRVQRVVTLPVHLQIRISHRLVFAEATAVPFSQAAETER